MDRGRGRGYQNFQNNRHNPVRVCPPRERDRDNLNTNANVNFSSNLNRNRRVNLIEQNPESDYRNPTRNFTYNPSSVNNEPNFSVNFNSNSTFRNSQNVDNSNFRNTQNLENSYKYYNFNSSSNPGNNWSNNSSPIIRDQESSSNLSNFSYEHKLKKHCADEAYLKLKDEFDKCQEKIKSLNSDNLRLENSAKNLRQKMFKMTADHSKVIDGLKTKMAQQKFSMKQEIDSLKSEKIRLQELTKILDNLLQNGTNDNELFFVEKDMDLCQNALEGGKFAQINKLTKDLNSSRNEVDDLNFEKVKLQKENQLLKSQICEKGNVSNDDYKKKISELEKKIKECRDRFQSDKSKLSAKNHKIQELYGENDVFRNQIIELENHTKKLEKMKHESKNKHEKELNELKIGFANDLKKVEKLEKLEMNYKRRCDELQRKSSVIRSLRDHANGIFDTLLAIDIEED